MSILPNGSARCESDLPDGDTLVLIFHAAKSEGLVSRGEQKLGTWSQNSARIKGRDLNRHDALLYLDGLGGYVSVHWTHDLPQDSRADVAFAQRTTQVIEAFFAAASRGETFRLRTQVLGDQFQGVQARYTPEAEVRRRADLYRASVPNHASGQITPERRCLEEEMKLRALKKRL